MFLHEEKHGYRRDGSNYRTGCDHLPGSQPLALEGFEPGSHRAYAVALDKYQGPEVVIPYKSENQNGQGRQGRTNQGEDQDEEDAKFSSTVAAGGRVRCISDPRATPSRG